MSTLFMQKKRLTTRELLGVLLALTERNIKLMTRFSVSMYMHYLGIFSDAAISAFLGTALISGAAAEQVGGDYVSYVIVGLAFNQFLFTSVTSPLKALSRAYWSAQLEPLLNSPVSVQFLVFADALWFYLNDLISIVIYLAVGLLFGMQLSGGMLYLQGLGVLILGSVSVLGFGFISAAMFSLINAKGFSEPVEWLIRTLQRLVCGVYFPVAILPGWLRAIGYAMPQTYVLDAVRRILIPTYPRAASLPLHGLIALPPNTVNLLVIALLTCIILPFGLWVFKKGMEKARYDGGLSRWT